MVTPLPGLHFYRVDYVSGFWFKLYLSLSFIWYSRRISQIWCTLCKIFDDSSTGSTLPLSSYLVPAQGISFIPLLTFWAASSKATWCGIGILVAFWAPPVRASLPSLLGSTHYCVLGFTTVLDFQGIKLFGCRNWSGSGVFVLLQLPPMQSYANDKIHINAKIRLNSMQAASPQHGMLQVHNLARYTPQ